MSTRPHTSLPALSNTPPPKRRRLTVPANQLQPSAVSSESAGLLKLAREPRASAPLIPVNKAFVLVPPARYKTDSNSTSSQSARLSKRRIPESSNHESTANHHDWDRDMYEIKFSSHSQTIYDGMVPLDIRSFVRSFQNFALHFITYFCFHNRILLCVIPASSATIQQYPTPVTALPILAASVRIVATGICPVLYRFPLTSGTSL